MSQKEVTCQICGAIFTAFHNTKYCHPCRRKKQTEALDKWRRNGASRQLGSEDVCLACGKAFTITSPSQKYCPDCRDSWRHAPPEKACRWCGKLFAHNGTKRSTCSAECFRLDRNARKLAYIRARKELSQNTDKPLV